MRTLALIISIAFALGPTSAFARGGGHGGGHGGHSGGHGGHPGDHPGHHGDHVGGKPGGITGGSFATGHFMNQNPCVLTDKTSADCLQFGEKQWQTIPARKVREQV